MRDIKSNNSLWRVDDVCRWLFLVFHSYHVYDYISTCDNVDTRVSSLTICSARTVQNIDYLSMKYQHPFLITLFNPNSFPKNVSPG